VLNYQQQLDDPKFNRPVSTWDVELTTEWLRLLSGDGKDKEWRKVHKVFSKKSIDGPALCGLVVEELVEFGVDKQKALAVLKARDEMLEMQRSADSKVDKKRQKAALDAEMSEKGVDDQGRVKVGVFDLTLQVEGAIDLNTVLVTKQAALPQAKLNISYLKMQCRVTWTLDMFHEEMSFGFQEKPSVESNLDVQVSKLEVPLMMEDSWFPGLIASLFESYNVENPLMFDFRD
jgi:hypothetical protein